VASDQSVAMSSTIGKILWQTPVQYHPIGLGDGPRYSSSYYAGGTFYGLEDNQIFAIDGASGKLRWSQVTGAGVVAALQVAP
jgi:outer membrane protein assembly factor BamB